MSGLFRDCDIIPIYLLVEGGYKSGKTKLCKRLKYREYQENDKNSEKLRIDNSYSTIDDGFEAAVTYVIHEICGNIQTSSFRSSYFSDSSIMLVFDIADRSLFDNLN